MNKQLILLVGGRSTEHDASIHSYFGVLQSFAEQVNKEIELRSIYYFTREGKIVRHDGQSSLPRDVSQLESGKFITFADFIEIMMKEKDAFIFSLLHGNEGEDGAWQGLAEILDMRGSFGSVFASAVSMNKWAMSIIAQNVCQDNLAFPQMWKIDRYTTSEELNEILLELGSKAFVIKPNRMGASHFTELFVNLSLSELENTLNLIKSYDSEILLQEYIKGNEYTCGCIEQPDKVLALPLIKVATARNFLGHPEKHINGFTEIEMFYEDNSLTSKIKEVSRKLFRSLDFSSFCRFDYIVTSNNEIYFLEANSIPGLMTHSAFPMMLRAGGFSLIDLIKISINNFENQPQRQKILQYFIED